MNLFALSAGIVLIGAGLIMFYLLYRTRPSRARRHHGTKNKRHRADVVGFDPLMTRGFHGHTPHQRRDSHSEHASGTAGDTR
jgi:hypothetical protein